MPEENAGSPVEAPRQRADSSPGPANVWVEKTHVKGRTDRLGGEFALGRALWSPARDRGGNDTYRFMREVRRGDIVLHLTDGEGFTGVSRAAQSYVEFGGVPNTEWGEQPSYLVRLRNFEQLDPPLSRQTFFRGQWGSRLGALRDHHKDLFYHSGLALRQGAYLTPLPRAVLEVLCEAYRSQVGRPLVGRDLQDHAPPYESSEVVPALAPPSAQAVSDWLFSTQGLTFSPESVAVFLTALQTKGFVILGGVSGTGKTRLAQAISALISDNEVEQQAFVPVRPDWRDSRGLLGYFNPLSGSYESTPLLQLLLLATSSDERSITPALRPHFVTLDEMNLARPEYYFAELLSVLESGRDNRTGFTREALPLHDRGPSGVRDAKGASIPDQLHLGPNLYFVGTINVDETTHTLSPKVLDRAFTLEIDEIEFDRPPASNASPPDGAALRAAFTKGESFARIDRDVVEQFISEHPDWTQWLQDLTDLLRPHDLHFAYRTFDEIAMFTMNAAAAPWFDGFDNSDLAAFDVACLTKVLPKFSGVRARLRPPLVQVLAWAINPNAPDPDAVEQLLAEPMQLSQGRNCLPSHSKPNKC